MTLLFATTGMSVSKALKYLRSKGLRFYYMNFSSYWNSGYVVVA